MKALRMVKLKDILDGMDFQNEEVSAYLNKRTGEVVHFSSDVLNAVEENKTHEEFFDWQEEEITAAKDYLANPKTYVPLPSKFDIHEWAIMERFCFTLDDSKTKEMMLDAIHGTGAFRMFKNNIHRFELVEKWYRFREESFKEIAKAWCDENDIPFEEV